MFLKLFKDFKFARKRLGGTWYYVIFPETSTGMGAPITIWTQEKPDNPEEILKVEEYPNAQSQI